MYIAHKTSATEFHRNECKDKIAMKSIMYVELEDMGMWVCVPLQTAVPQMGNKVLTPIKEVFLM